MDFKSSPNIPAIGAVISGNYPISSLSYHENGKRLFAASEDDKRLHIIDCLEGKSAQPSLRCEREGIKIVSATHHDHCVLFTGSVTTSPQAGAIHYMSVYDNKILRKFRGHTGPVTHLSMSPADDTFLSSSVDGTCRLWDIRQAGSIAQVNCSPENDINRQKSVPVGMFDASGLVFALTSPIVEDGATSPGQYLNLFDARNYSAGGFAEFKVLHSDVEQHLTKTSGGVDLVITRSPWHGLSFNQSGNRILAMSDAGICIVLDGFEGTIQRVFRARTQHRHVAACFSSDDQTLLAGQDDGSVICWDIISGTALKTLTGHTGGRVGAVVSNPKYAQIATSCTQTALWCF